MQQTLGEKFGKKPLPEKMEIEYKRAQVNLPWVEKYRPNTIDEISFQEEVVQSLKGVLSNGNLPNTLLYGPPGTGKTSTILALAKQLYGDEFYRQRILELNASDDRGIAVVREKVKKFAQLMCVKNTDKKYLCPNYKIIILDEADLMTHDAQSALRRIMEDTSSNTRFCIICNYVTKIIEPLTSRCVNYRFKPISLEAQFQKLKFICNQEQINCTDEALNNLIEISEGDLRKSINTLQIASTLYKKEINSNSINEISGIIPQNMITLLFQRIKEASLENLIKEVDNVLYEGYSSIQIINQLFNLIISNQEIKEIQKAQIIEKIAYCEKLITEGSNDQLALYDLFGKTLQIIEQV